jgi:hypothetical protein
MYLLYYYDMAQPSLAVVGALFNRDHCTVMHSIKKINDHNSVHENDRLSFNLAIDKLKEFILRKYVVSEQFRIGQMELEKKPNLARRTFKQS